MRRLFRVEYQGAPRHVVEQDGEARLVEGDVFGAHERGDPVALADHRRLAPVLPSKIVAIGLNYRGHALERNKPLPDEPMIFIKPSTAVIGPGDPIVLPPAVGRVDHEAEVGVVIGRRAWQVPEADAPEYIWGVTCVNDVTARELQAKDVQYTRAKGFDTFAPVGPCVVGGLDYRSAAGLAVEAWVNGTRRQSSSTRELIFGIDKLIAFVSSVMTLLPGDIIATGTPSGIGPLAPGDTVTINVEDVGELTNPVIGSAAVRSAG
jgi:2-keto-4-pentenoate hydratase/2-oxohepta-3-ene-1,7-dioic acid hydratase in catechol pathway